MTYTYDGDNKQVEVKNSSAVTIGRYWYDGDGRRVKKYVPGTGETTIFVYDAAGKLVAEYSTVIQEASRQGDSDTRQDWILLGATTLRHEQWHRDAPTRADRLSERQAYRVSYSVLLRFEHDFSPGSSLFAKRKEYFAQRMK